jgi:hypothetical protein
VRIARQYSEVRASRGRCAVGRHRVVSGTLDIRRNGGRRDVRRRRSGASRHWDAAPLTEQ